MARGREKGNLERDLHACGRELPMVSFASFVCLLMHVLLMGVKRAKVVFLITQDFYPSQPQLVGVATPGGRRYPL